MRKTIGMLVVLVVVLWPTRSVAQVPAPAPAPEPGGPKLGPKLGGHIALGTTFVTVGTGPTLVIGRDMGPLAVVAGINVGLTKKWSADFEFIVISDFKDATRDVSKTTFVLDPGIVYDWGPLWTGLRIAMRVPAGLNGAEFGFIPIIGTKWKISSVVAYFIELDLPMFIHGPPGFTFNVFLQTGVAF